MRETAIQRAKQDEAAGDLGMARARLCGYLNSKGYDADLLAEIGRLSFDIQDLYHAGRYWLTSSAVGPDVDRAIAHFLGSTSRKPQYVVAELPRVCRFSELSGYSPPVQERLRKLGLDCAILWRPRRPSTGSPMRRWFTIPLWVVLIVAVLLGILSAALQLAERIGNWVFG